MNSLDEIVSALTPIMITQSPDGCGEILYNFESFKQKIDFLLGEFIEVKSSFIIPNYCFQGKRYELYEYELIITFNDEPFDKFLIRKTGQVDVKCISREIYFLRKECYIQVPYSEPEITIQRINQYVDFLYKNPNIKQKIEKIFNEFDPKYLAFTYFSA